jgi:hypothetical protein
MKTVEYTELPTDELLKRVLRAAETLYGDDSEERWALVSALHRRPEQGVFDQAAAWCGSSKATERALGADILGQLGASSRPQLWPFAAESTPILVQLFHDPSDQVVASAFWTSRTRNSARPPPRSPRLGPARWARSKR